MPCKEDIRKAWIDFIKIKKGPSWQETKNVFICKLHFDASSYRTPLVSNPDRIYLKADAIPSILATTFYNVETMKATNLMKAEKHNEELSTSCNCDAENIIGKK